MSNSFPTHLPEKPHVDQVVKEFAESLGLKEPLSRQFLTVVVQAAQVFDYKQKKYGPENIGEFGETGVIIRVTDKIKRRVNLWRTNQRPADETIEDTWGDIANYAIIALMCRYGKWPGVEAATPRPCGVTEAIALREQVSA